MVCDSCARAIVHELEQLEGVIAAEVDHESGLASVTFDSHRTDSAAVAARIEKLGFGVQPVGAG